MKKNNIAIEIPSNHKQEENPISTIYPSHQQPPPAKHHTPQQPYEVPYPHETYPFPPHPPPPSPSVVSNYDPQARQLSMDSTLFQDDAQHPAQTSADTYSLMGRVELGLRFLDVLEFDRWLQRWSMGLDLFRGESGQRYRRVIR